MTILSHMPYKRHLSKIHFLPLHTIFLICIIIASFYFRFYNTPNRYGFDPDPVRDALTIYQGATHFQFPLTGAMSGIAPFTFGPWYYYQLILFQILFPLNYAPWIFIGLSSVLAVFVMYKIGSSLENKWFGLMLALFMALSPSETGQTQGLSNPDLVPLYTTLIIWIFIMLMKKNTASWWLLIWGVVFGIGINIHYQIILLLPLFLFYLYFNSSHILKKSIHFFLGLGITFIPLLLFNLFTNWHTVRGVLYYVTIGRATTYIPNSWKIYLFSFWLPYLSYIFGLTNLNQIILFFLSIMGLVYASFIKKLHRIYLIFILTFILDFFILRYFLANRDYYYYLFLHPIIFILVGFALWQLRTFRFGKVAILFILFFIIIGMIPQDQQRLVSRVDNIGMSNQAEFLMNKFPNRPISIYACSNNRVVNLAEGIVFFLKNNHRLGMGEGTKIAIINNDCKTTLSGFAKYEEYSEVELTNDLALVNQKKLMLITPKEIYNANVSWW